MLDEKQLKRRVLLRTLGSPLTVVPFLLGMTAMTVGWALDVPGGLGWFAGLVGVMTGAGAFLTRLLLSGAKVSEDVSREMRAEEVLSKQRALDDLDRHLSEADDDPRPEAALRDLRGLLEAFWETGAGEATAASVADIQWKVSRLFDQCVRSLEQTAELWKTARQLNTPEARAPILEQREQLIGEIQGSVRQFSNTLVSLRAMGQGTHSNAELKRVREDLDEGLAVAKRVEERLSSFVNEAHLSAHEESFQINQERKGQ